MSREVIVPIADWWRKRAASRGQTADRFIPRGVNEIWPYHEWVDERNLCPRAKDIPLFHTPHDICRNCGALVRVR